jgi:hypothetical protein
MSPRAGLVAGLVLIIDAVGLFVAGLEAELDVIQARLDQHQTLLEVLATVLDMAPRGGASL